MSSEQALQHAYFLHVRRYQESSCLIDCLTREAGLITLVAKGAKRPKSKWRALMQPFIGVYVAWRGRGDVKTLIQCEALQLLPLISGKTVLLGLYVNELILNMLHRADAHPQLFDYYHQTITQLASLTTTADLESQLRHFECQLLESLGFGIELKHDAKGHAIIADVVYGYDPEEGFLSQTVLPQSNKSLAISGATLLALAHQEALVSAAQRLEAKQLMRQAIGYHLGDKPIKTRKLFSSIHSFMNQHGDKVHE